MDIPALNTTHADTFYTDIPVSYALNEEQIKDGYELNTGKAIVDTFNEKGLDYLATPGALVSQHGPFTWGKSPSDAVYNAKVLKIVAEEDFHTLLLTRGNSKLPQYLLDKHYYRKHGSDAYYGQNSAKSSNYLCQK